MAADGDTKEQLVLAARGLYLEGGLASLSLREVARRVGVSAPAVYRHFDDKEALVAAVCARGFAAFGAFLMRSLAAPTPRARMLAASRMYLAFALTNPQDYQVIFMGAADRIAPSADHPPGPSGAPTFRFLVDRVRECVAAGVLAPGDEQDIAAMIWAVVHGLVSLRLTGHFAQIGDEAAFTRFYDAAVERFLAGLAPAR